MFFFTSFCEILNRSPRRISRALLYPSFFFYITCIFIENTKCRISIATYLYLRLVAFLQVVGEIELNLFPFSKETILDTREIRALLLFRGDKFARLQNIDIYFRFGVCASARSIALNLNRDYIFRHCRDGNLHEGNLRRAVLLYHATTPSIRGRKF